MRDDDDGGAGGGDDDSSSGNVGIVLAEAHDADEFEVQPDTHDPSGRPTCRRRLRTEEGARALEVRVPNLSQRRSFVLLCSLRCRSQSLWSFWNSKTRFGFGFHA